MMGISKRRIAVLLLALSPSLAAIAQHAAGVGLFLPTKANAGAAPGAKPSGMVWVPGGEFSMGGEDPRGKPDGGMESMDDARPIHRVYVTGFWMDQTDVTNAEFERFVRATHYITVAERTPRKEDFPGVDPRKLVPGSAVFHAPAHPVDLNDATEWWSYIPGANWRHPRGPGSSIQGREAEPVTQVAYEDAVAYANWAQKRLPTEAEWEFAARGGATGKRYAWGDELRPGGHSMANTFQGSFPMHDAAVDGYAGISPVSKYPANGYGLYDMAGNVWQWVSDWYRPDYYATLAGAVARDPKGPASSLDPMEPGLQKRVQRGGSFLCTEEYCSRYLVGSRGKGEVSTASNHVGFRCVRGAGG